MDATEYKQIVRIAEALERIATVLERAVTMPETPTPAACTHPVDQRIDFGVTDGVEDWQCGVKGCGFRSTQRQAVLA